MAVDNLAVAAPVVAAPVDTLAVEPSLLGIPAADTAVGHTRVARVAQVAAHTLVA